VGPPLHFPFARVNQQPTSAPWRISDQETIFCWVSVPLS
jgi:hypothetical protein